MAQRAFASRSTGVLFWAAGYLVVAIAWGVALASLWPQGNVCTSSCGDRIEAGAVGITLLAAGGLAGLGVALWLGVTRRAGAPRWLVYLLLALLVASLASAAALMQTGSSSGESAGLATVRSAWSWALVVPTSALLAMSSIAGVRGRVRARRALVVRSARVRA